MMKTGKSVMVALLLAAAGIAANVGCSAPPPEPQGKTTSKLLAPKALVKMSASADSMAAFGIVEWRVYRGRGDVVITGYDKKGSAVKGIAVGFDARSSNVVNARLHGKALDGSGYTVRHEYGGAQSAPGLMPTDTAKLFRLAMHDLRGPIFHMLPPKPAPSGTPPAGTPAPAPAPSPAPAPAPMPTPLPQMPGGQGCGQDLMVMLAAALQCFMQAGGNKQAVMQCILAAQGGAGAGQSCGAPGAGGMDPGGMCGDPTGGMGDPNDPNGPYGDPNGGQPLLPPLPQGAPQGGADPTGGMCTDPGGMADQAGNAPSCPSCPPGGGYGDIEGDPANGEVSGAPQGDEGI